MTSEKEKKQTVKLVNRNNTRVQGSAVVFLEAKHLKKATFTDKRVTRFLVCTALIRMIDHHSTYSFVGECGSFRYTKVWPLGAITKKSANLVTAIPLREKQNKNYCSLFNSNDQKQHSHMYFQWACGIERS